MRPCRHTERSSPNQFRIPRGIEIGQSGLKRESRPRVKGTCWRIQGLARRLGKETNTAGGGDSRHDRVQQLPADTMPMHLRVDDDPVEIPARPCTGDRAITGVSAQSASSVRENEAIITR